jgi:hypothetical protein
VKRTVDALNALSIFGPHHGGAYREHSAFVREVLGEDVPTKIGDFIRDWASSGEARAVVLTGNAGTGKTALAEAYCGAAGAELPDVDGLVDLGRDRFVVKDLSGVPQEAVRNEAITLAAAIRDDKFDGQLLLCANEGMLRAAIGSADQEKLIVLLDGGLENGAAVEEKAVVVNMNRQRWTSREMWEKLLDYLTRQELWERCDGCGGGRCPLCTNSAALRKPEVREAARWLVQFASGGGVATLREILAIVSYAITGGLSCEEVQQRLEQHGDNAFSADDAYFNLLLGAGLSSARAERSPLLQGLLEAGVGKTADLEVDSWLRDAGDAPREIGDLASSDGDGVHSRVVTALGPMSFKGLGEAISLSDDSATVDACLHDLADGRNFLSLWRKRVFFEASAFVGGRAGAFTRLSRFSYFDDLLDLAEALRAGQEVAEERQRLVTGLNYLAAGFHSFAGHLVVPDSASLAARNPGSFRPPAPSLVHGEIPVERVTIRLEDGEELRAILDADDVRVILSVHQDNGRSAELILTPRLYQAIRDSADFRTPVGGDIPEMTELEALYAELASAPAPQVVRVVDPGREAIRSVTLPSL